MAAVIFLSVLGLTTLLADIIANDRPLYCEYEGKSHFPVFTPTKVDSIYDELKNKYIHFSYNRIDWRSLHLEAVVWPLIPYGPKTMDSHNKGFKSPGSAQVFMNAFGEEKPLTGRFRHLLGTTKNGQDVLASIIHGARISLLVGVVSMGIATLIGLFLGAIAGFFGDTRFKRSRGMSYMLIFGLFLCYFYGYYVRKYTIEAAGEESFGAMLGQIGITLLISMGILWACNRLAAKVLNRVPFFAKKGTIPVDSLVSRTIEILRSVPVILIVISFSVIFKGSIWFVMLVIGLTSWTGVARLVRAELLRIVNLDYIEAARALGFPEWRMILRHAIPNGMAPVLISISFGIAGAIISESSLSFLNIGVAADTITWGKLLRMGSSNFEAWWLTVFPGFAIFLTVMSFNIIGERLRDVLDPRSK